MPARRCTPKIAEKASAVAVGDPTDPGNVLGPIIDTGQRDKIHQIVTETVARGAQLLEGRKISGAGVL